MTSISMPVEKWPVADQAAWQEIFSLDDLFDEPGGSCSAWSAATRKGHCDRYGNWLSFLALTHPSDLSLPPCRRVTRERVTEYLDYMSNRPEGYTNWRVVKKLALSSQSISIWTLDTVMRAFSQNNDWAWLRCAAQRLTAQAQIERQPQYLGVSATNLSKWALGKIVRIESQDFSSPKHRALAHRNHLAVAILIHCPVRRRALCALDIVDRVQRTASGYLLRFPANDMKDRKARTFPLHSRLTKPIDDYLQIYRPVLLGGAKHSALWVTYAGQPMRAGAMRYMISLLTQVDFGKRLNVHDFRRIAATSIAEYNPERAGIIRDVLGHSTMKMADKHYNQARALEAMEAHQDILESAIKRARKAASPEAKTTRQ